jgi:hypothetical protein
MINRDYCLPRIVSNFNQIEMGYGKMKKWSVVILIQIISY